MKKRKISVLFALGISLIASGAFAQRHSHDSRMYFDYGNPLMASVLQSADGHSADVRISTANSMFSFLHSKNPDLGAYYTIRDVTIEALVTGDEQPLLTRNIVDTIYAKTFEESISKSAWHAMNEHLEFPTLDTTKHYSVRIEVRDDIDRLAAHPQEFPLHFPRFENTATKEGIAFGDITLADSMTNGLEYSAGRGNTYMFSRPITGSVPVRIASALTNPAIDISVRQTRNTIDPADTGIRFTETLDAGDLHKGETFQFVAADSLFRYKLQPAADPNVYTAIFHVPGEQFQQGTYEFTVRVKSGSIEESKKDEFQLIWENMPVSLEDPQDAIDPLSIIAQPDEVNGINSGTSQEKRTKLYAYWKKFDPTPATAYNERMATFYQRVDYADFNFATGRILNGATSDRGKVYLLYGPPTKIDRTFIPGDAPTETWTYTNNVQRIFHFEEHGSPGEYKLANIEQLAASGKE